MLGTQDDGTFIVLGLVAYKGDTQQVAAIRSLEAEGAVAFGYGAAFKGRIFGVEQCHSGIFYVFTASGIDHTSSHGALLCHDGKTGHAEQEDQKFLHQWV